MCYIQQNPFASFVHAQKVVRTTRGQLVLWVYVCYPCPVPRNVHPVVILWHSMTTEQDKTGRKQMRSLAPKPVISDVGHFEKINDEVWRVLFVL